MSLQFHYLRRYRVFANCTNTSLIVTNNTEMSRRLTVAVANYIAGRSMKCVRVAKVIEHDVTPIAIVCATPPVDEDD